MFVGLSDYHGTTNGHVSMTFTKGGSDTAMVKASAPDNGSGWGAALFWLVLPDTGSGKSLKWAWDAGSANGYKNFSITFWKGIETCRPGARQQRRQGFPAADDAIADGAVR